jgi:hypothetical protein
MPKQQRRGESSAKRKRRNPNPGQFEDPNILAGAGVERVLVPKTRASKTGRQVARIAGGDGARAIPFTPAADQTVNQQIFLAGLSPTEEFMQATAQQPPPRVPWEDRWHQAAAVRQTLVATEGGVADNPETRPLPLELDSLLGPVHADVVFQQAVPNTAFTFRMVEVDKLVVYQKFINVDHVEAQNDQMSLEMNPQELIDFCFPLRHQGSPPTIHPAGTSVYIISESSDMRPLPPGPQFLPLDPSQIASVMNQPLPRTISTGIGLLILFGYGLNFLHALSVDGRLVLNNAYHRTYRLRRQGQTHVPCLVQTVTSDQLAALVAGTPLALNPDMYLRNPRPPLFKDFFDPQLHVKLANRPTRSMYRVTARIEVEGRIFIH